MNIAQFVPELATVLGVEQTALRSVDRSLADSGLREKSRGRTYPDVTRAEALRLLLGIGGSRVLTEAAPAVRDLEAFRLAAGQANHGDAWHLAAFGFTMSAAEHMTLAEALAAFCGHLAGGLPEGTYAGVRIERGGPVHLEFDDHAGRSAALQFIGGVDYHGHPGLAWTAEVRPHALIWVGKNTAASA